MKKSEAVFALAQFISPKVQDKNVLEQLFQSVENDWEMIIQQANRYLLVPALYVSLKEKNLYDKLEDKMLQEYLYEMYKLNKQRNEAIILQVQELCSYLGAIEVTPLLLKGSSALSEHYFDDDAQRSMMDIDIAVPETKIFEAITLLKQKGYKEIDPTQELGKTWHHYRRLYREDRATSVELHRMVINHKAMKFMADFEKTKDTQSATDISNARVLSPTYELYYTFLHSEVSHEYHTKIITLRHLHHSAVFIHKYQNEIDFEKLQALVEKYNLQKIWYEYLWLLKELFAIDTPLTIPAQKHYVKQVCHNIDTEKSFWWWIKVWIKKIIDVFSFETLQRKCDGLEHRYQLIYFIPKRFFFLGYKILTDTAKRKVILKGIKTTV